MDSKLKDAISKYYFFKGVIFLTSNCYTSYEINYFQWLSNVKIK